MSNSIDTLLKKYKSHSVEELPESPVASGISNDSQAGDDPYKSKWAQPLTTSEYSWDNPSIRQREKSPYEPVIRYQFPEPEKSSRTVYKSHPTADQAVLEKLFKMIDAAEQDSAKVSANKVKAPMPPLALPPRPSTSAPPVSRKLPPYSEKRDPAVLRKMDSGIGASSENLTSIELVPASKSSLAAPQTHVVSQPPPQLPISHTPLAVKPSPSSSQSLGVLYFRLKRLSDIAMSTKSSSAYVYLVIRHGQSQVHYTKATIFTPGQPVELQNAEIALEYMGGQTPVSVELHCRVDQDSGALNSRYGAPHRQNTLKNMFKNTSSRPSLQSLYEISGDSKPGSVSRSQSVMSNASEFGSPSWPKAQTGLVGCLDVVNLKELVGASQLALVSKTVGLSSLLGAGIAGGLQHGIPGVHQATGTVKNHSSIKGFFKSFRRKSSSQLNSNLGSQVSSRANSVMDFTDSANSIAKVEMDLIFVPNPAKLDCKEFPTSLSDVLHWMESKDWHKRIFAQGYLSQRGGDLRYWRRRHFILVGSRLKAYKENDCKELRYEINLACDEGDCKGLAVRVTDDFRNSAEEDEIDEVKIPFGFRVEFFRPQTGEKTKMIEFYANNDEEKDYWIQRIKQTIESSPRYITPAWYVPLKSMSVH